MSTLEKVKTWSTAENLAPYSVELVGTFMFVLVIGLNSKFFH